MICIKPSFILSKGQRKNFEYSMEDKKENLYRHYAEIYATRFRWENIPSDCPQDFIERMLFYIGMIAPIKVFNENQILGVKTARYGIYSNCITFLPEVLGSSVFPEEIMKEYQNSKNPVLDTRKSVAYDIEFLIDIMCRTYQCLEMTLMGMEQPVVVSGVVGGEVSIQVAQDRIKDGKLTIPVLEKSNLQASVLDLGGKDYTQNLISTINHLDCEILARMGIKSAGTEKASGVTTEETLSINQELALINQKDLELRQKWCNNPIIKEMFPDIKVTPSKSLDFGEKTGEENDRNSSEKS